MKYIVTFVVLLTGCTNLQAQQGKITGRVVDSGSRAPIEYATISLYKVGQQKPVNGNTAGKDGAFSISDLAIGDYTVTIGFIGYKDQRSGVVTIAAKTSVVNLGEVLLSKKAQDLAAVTVTASKGLVENKIDKMVYNAEKDITSQGGVATDILKKVPMVSVDVDGNVELQGNANVLFLINGKPSSIFGNNLADALQSIPASQIKTIEVITAPGAKYDAEGTGGIINIVLKENRLRGMNGNLSLTAGSRLENGSLNLNARTGNFGMNAFFSGNAQLRSSTSNSSDRESVDTAAGTFTRLLQKGQSDFERNGYESGLGFEWNADKQNTISGNIGYDNFGNKNKGGFDQHQIVTGSAASDLASVVRSQNQFRGQSIDWNLNYKRTFAQEDRELDISYDGSYGRNNSSYSQDQRLASGGDPFSGSSSNSAGHDKEMNFRLDYVQPLSEKVKLETGGRVQLRRINSVVDVYNLENFYDTSQSTRLNYNRNVYAGYASLAFPLFGWVDVKGGLRYERTETDAVFSKGGGVNIPGYNTLAPSIVFSRSMKGDQTIKISYAKRIQRPNYRWLSPYTNASDPKNITTGNPYLQPEVSHNIDLTYSKSFEKGSALNVVLFYHRSEQDIQPFISYYADYVVGDSTYQNVSVSMPVNVGAENNYGLTLYGSVPVGPKINLRSNLNFFNRYITAGGLQGKNSITSFNYRLNMNATWQVSPTLIAEFFGNFNSARNELQGKFPSFTSYNFAFRKQIWHKQGSIGFTTTNPFANRVTQETSVTGSGFTLLSIRQVPYRSFGLNFTWKFGKLTFKKDKEEKEPPAPMSEGG